MNNKILVRTLGGDQAWRSLPLPPNERRMLGLVRNPLPEHAVKMLIGQDPLFSVMLSRGWLKWDVEDSETSLSAPHQLPHSEKSSALARLHQRIEEKKEEEKRKIESSHDHQIPNEDFIEDKAFLKGALEMDVSVTPQIIPVEIQDQEKDKELTNQEEKEEASSYQVSDEEKEESLKRFLNLFQGIPL